MKALKFKYLDVEYLLRNLARSEAEQGLGKPTLGYRDEKPTFNSMAEAPIKIPGCSQRTHVSIRKKAASIIKVSFIPPSSNLKTTIKSLLFQSYLGFGIEPIKQP